MAKQNYTVNTTRVVVDSTNNQMFIICNPNKVNAKGAYRFTATQFANLATQAGLSTKQLIRNIAGAKLSYSAEFVKAGDEWVNEKTGETGHFKVDHFRIDNYCIEISVQKALNIEIAEAQAEKMQSGFSFDAFMNGEQPFSVTENGEQPVINNAPIVEEQQA